jgi:hypothetical protein
MEAGDMVESSRITERVWLAAVALLVAVALGSGRLYADLDLKHPLPGWYPGDGHVHTKYSSWDLAYATKAAPTVQEMAKEARDKGLTWIVITDHEQMFILDRMGAFYPTDLAAAERRWQDMQADCNRECKDGFLVLPGEEVGSVETGYKVSHGHYLAYGIAGLTNSSPTLDGLGMDCRSMIGATAAQGGFGFIAHPNGGIPWGDTVFDWADWRSSTQYTGAEVINNGKLQDAWPDPYASQGGRWDFHLSSELDERTAGLTPATAHVGVAGSDAHVAKDLGLSLTYVYLPDNLELNPRNLFAALKAGRCVAATDRVFVACKLDDADIGGTLELEYGASPTLAVQWRSDSPLTALKAIGKDGRTLHEWSGSDLFTRGGSTDGSTTVTLPAFTESGYVRLEATATDRRKYGVDKKHEALTNPIWVIVRRPNASGEPVRLRSKHGDVTALIAGGVRDFRLTLDVNVASREGSLFFRMSSDSGVVSGQPTYGLNGYGVIFCPFSNQGANPGLYLVKRVNGVEQTLASTQTGFPRADGESQLTVSARGGELAVYENGRRILRAEDSSYDEGEVVLRVYGDPESPADAQFRVAQFERLR